jgi:multiple sugar transport system substrate-binding protein
MRSVITVVAAVTAIGVLLLSCTEVAAPQPTATPTRSRNERIVIRYWDFQQSALDIQAAQELARQRFESENPDLRVEVEVFPSSEYRQRLLNAISAGNPPDVATIDQIWLAEFASNGWIVPLDDRLGGEAQPKLFFASAWQTCLYRGHTWGIPLNFDGWMQLYYNREMFRAAGLDPDRPPTTWAEFYEAGQRLTRPPDQYGLALLGNRGEGLAVSANAFIFSNGGRILDDRDSRALINQPAVVVAVAYYGRLRDVAPPGVERVGEQEAVDQFMSGKTAMALLGAWQQDTFRQRAPRLDWGVGLLPAPAGKPVYGALGGWNVALFAGSAHPNEAFRYVEFLSRKEVQLSVNSLTPARRDAGREFIRKRRRGPDVLEYMSEQSLPRPMSPDYPRISEIEQEMLQRVLAGASAQDAADQAATEIDQLPR